MIFKIYTEDKNEQGIVNLTSNVFSGFTLYKTKGYWQGQAENSIVIEVVSTEQDREKVVSLAKDIKELNKQESVLVNSYQEETSTF